MNLVDAQALAIKLMADYKLEGWTFEFDYAKSRYGVCFYNRKQIKLSAALTIMNDAANVENTIRHEIAHALLGYGFGHSHAWKVVAGLVGASPKTCCDDGVILKGKVTATCEGCKKEYNRHRLPKEGRKLYCGNCFKSGTKFYLSFERK